MITQLGIEEVILFIPFGPVATVLLAGLLLVLVIWVAQLIISNGARIGLLRGLAVPYNRYLLVIVFITFLTLSVLAFQSGLGFDSPILLVLAIVLIILFEGWEVSNVKRTVAIFVVAMLGALIGHNLAPIL